MSEAKNQHYVPQFLLRHFANPATKALHTFDKQTRRSFVTNPRNVAGETYFYEVEVEAGVRVSMEEALAGLEATAAAVLGKVIAAESLSSIGIEERVEIARFFAVQVTRTRQLRAMVQDVGGQIEAWLHAMGMDPTKVDGFSPIGTEEAKRITMQLTEESRRELVPHFMTKTWLLVRNTTEQPFMLSDNPVALYNSRPAGFFGNLGLASPGVEIHLPLTPRLGLTLLCPSIEQEVRHGNDLLVSLANLGVPGLDRFQAGAAFAKSFIAAAEHGDPIDLSPERVLHENSLQVCSSERWLFSPTGDFQLPIKMLDKHPELAKGPRLTGH